jgi:gas vesicle structural protein
MLPDDSGPLEGRDALAAELDFWESSLESGEGTSLVDLINRVLDKGVVITGHVTISVAGVDLVYLGLNAVLTSVSGARRRVREGALGVLEEGGGER